MRAQKPRILAIDDSEESLETLAVAFSQTFPDAELLTARSGGAGLRLAAESLPDLVLLDVRMPDMDGFETCRRLKADARLGRIPVAFLTAARPDKALCEQALKAGAEGFITKPFEFWELALQARTLLKISAAGVSLRGLVEQRTRELAEQLEVLTRTLKSLKESEAIFKTVFDSSPIGICLIEQGSGRFLRVNPALALLIGRTPEELAGLTWRDITHPDDLAAQAESLAALVNGGAEVVRLEKRYLRPDGSVVWIKLTAAALPAPEGAARRYLGMVEDITAAKDAERERAALEAQLRQSQKMEIAGSLAGGIAHDFNNILSAILTCSDFLIKDLEENDPKRRDAEEIKRTGLRAANLTRQLLSFSRKQVLQPKRLDLAQAVAGMAPMLRRLISEDIELVTLVPDGPVFINADPGYLEQVLLNLCVNARDAMPRGGRLTLETRAADIDAGYAHRHGTLQPGRYAMIAVSDTGCGMSEATKSHIFEPFFTTKPRDKGTGLGLSTVHGIVRQSGGSIIVYSEEGRGTVFKLFFPLAAGAPSHEEKAASAARFPAARGTVLVVDDDDQIRSLARRILGGDGLSVTEAASAEEALSLCGRKGARVDLLLTDMVLPGMTGPELAQRLKGRFHGVKVIYMSGYTDHTVLNGGMLAPDENFIQKPFSVDLLTQKVRGVLAAAR
jgi:PAS domain S-box-containing protein